MKTITLSTIIALMLATSASAFGGLIADLDKTTNDRCRDLYNLGWNSMSSNAQIHYVVVCKTRGWA